MSQRFAERCTKVQKCEASLPPHTGSLNAKDGAASNQCYMAEEVMCHAAHEHDWCVSEARRRATMIVWPSSPVGESVQGQWVIP
ncbi:hypothetical protein MHYP_G00245340 [Metynnis hypsauchen]